MTRPPFDVAAELPRGIVSVQASAGTGKTWAMAALATRFVAEGDCGLDQLLVVTFARSATRELRHRVRERLAQTAAFLDDLGDGPVPEGCADPLLLRLGGRGAEERAVVAARLDAALADFDRATITTIHGFGGEVLRALGAGADGAILESTSALEAEITADVRLRLARTEGVDLAHLPWKNGALEIARAAIALRGAPVLPPAGHDEAPALRAALAAMAAEEFDRRSRRRRVRTHDDVLRGLRDALDDPVRGAAAATRLRGRFRVGLVDEFQDTDPVQWAILQRLFAGEDARLVVVGDPKQAIYAFRGADVQTYVAAAGQAVAEYGLDVNRRSDARLVQAAGHLFEGVDFGEGIDAPEVAAHHGERLTGLGAAPLVVRLVADDVDVLRDRNGKPRVDAARELVARDVAAEVVGALEAGGQLALDGDAAPCDVEPADVAVLVRTNAQAGLVQRALHAAGVPAVLNGVGDVLATDAARDWLRLLEALERPSEGTRARLAALGPLVGWGAERVATAGERDWDELHVVLHRWARTLRRHGPAALHRQIGVDTELPARVLALEGGRRALTDLDHVAQLLHGAASAGGLGWSSLAGWLRAGIADANEEPSDARARRLESDADAVQILTVHASKGLQFPIVLCPYLWDSNATTPQAFAFHDEATGVRTLEVGGAKKDVDYKAHAARYEAERAAEERRLVYVAVTRAQCRAVVWWMQAGNAPKAPLTRVLFPRGMNGAHAKRVTALEGLVERAGGTVALEVVSGAVAAAHWQRPEPPARDLAAAAFDRPLDRTWRRTSFSSLVAAAHRAGEEEDQRVLADEPVAGVDDAVDEVIGGDPAAATPAAMAAPGSAAAAALDEAVPLAAMPGGPDVGIAVHQVLEDVDFADADLDVALEDGVRRAAQRFAVDLGDAPTTAAGLALALRTPLGAVAGDRPLTAFARADRLDELPFELPVAGGDDAVRDVVLGGLADLLDTHLASDDPLAGYGAALRRSLGEVGVRGYLVGRIDLVLRTPPDGPGGDRRYVVLDHKTNWLGAPGDDGLLRGRAYTRERMAADMVRSHYPLQALLYVVAVHRFLRWRLGGGYDPDRHLGGVLYLFLRGMTGPDAPRDGGYPTGVFGWRPPTALVLGLDDLLRAGGGAA